MSHPPVCPCPNCSRGGWGWLIAVLAAVAAVLAGARAAAPALGRLVHELVAWAPVVAVAGSMTAIGGYIAVSAVRGRQVKRTSGPEASDHTPGRARKSPSREEGKVK